MDAAFSDTSDRLVSSEDLLNAWMQNLWQYSSFSSNHWGQLHALISFNRIFQSKTHLFKDPANSADAISFPSQVNWLLTIGAIPMATIFRIKGLLSTVSSVSCNNRGSLVFSDCRSECAWPSPREAASSFNTLLTTARKSIVLTVPRALKLSGEILVKVTHRRRKPALPGSGIGTAAAATAAGAVAATAAGAVAAQLIFDEDIKSTDHSCKIILLMLMSLASTAGNFDGELFGGLPVRLILASFPGLHRFLFFGFRSV